MEFFNNLVLIFCSLGLMVVGANFIATNIRSAFDRLITVIGKGCHKNSSLRAMWGIILGALTQSFSVVAFIGANLVMNENMLLRNALLLSAWGSVGTSLSFLNIALSRETLAYLLVGISGISFYQKLNEKWTHIRLCVLGYGILFLGLTFMIPAAQHLKKSSIIFDFLSQPVSPVVYLMMWVVGAITGFIPYILMMLVIGFSAAGILSLSKGMVLIYGMAIGQAIFAWTISNQPSQVVSVTRKIGMFRIIYGSIGSIVLLILFFIEEYAGVPLVKALLINITDSQIFQVIILGVLTTLFSIALSFPFIDKIEKLLLSWEPILQFVDESKPKFINTKALALPDLALQLLLKDEVRMIEFLQKYIDVCRAPTVENSDDNLKTIDTIHNNVTGVLRQLSEFESRLQESFLSHRTSLILISLIERNSIIVSLDSSIYQFADHAIKNTDLLSREIVSSLTESLDTVLIVATELNGDPLGYAEVLQKMTFDRKARLNELRDKYLIDKPELTQQVKSAIIIVCGIAERIFWLYQKLAENLLGIIETIAKLDNPSLPYDKRN